MIRSGLFRMDEIILEDWIKLDFCSSDCLPQGSFTELTLGREIFLGGHPNPTDRLRRSVGLDSREAEPEVGFVGCLRSLQVNGKTYDLRRGAFIGDAVYGMDVGK